MIERHPLADAATHRASEKCGLLDAERLHQTNLIGGDLAGRTVLVGDVGLAEAPMIRDDALVVLAEERNLEVQPEVVRAARTRHEYQREAHTMDVVVHVGPVHQWERHVSSDVSRGVRSAGRWRIARIIHCA
jgi:hypothetical protein